MDTSILIVEDEEKLARFVELELGAEGTGTGIYRSMATKLKDCIAVLENRDSKPVSREKDATVYDESYKRLAQVISSQIISENKEFARGIIVDSLDKKTSGTSIEGVPDIFSEQC